MPKPVTEEKEKPKKQPEEEAPEETTEEETTEETQEEETTEEESTEEEGGEEAPDETEDDGEDLGDVDGSGSPKGSYSAKLDEILSELRGGKKQDRAVEKEWTLEELRRVEGDIEAGKLDPKYRVFVAEKRAELISERTAKNFEEVINFRSEWAASMSEAKKQYPDLKNPKSELFKLAKQLVLENRSYQRYLADATAGKKVNPTSYGLDPQLQLVAAQRASAMLAKKTEARPKSKATPKDALEGGGRSVATSKDIGQSQLDTLEKKAVASGSQSDWKSYFVQREKYLRGKKK